MSASNQHKCREFAAAPPTPASACSPASVQSIIHSHFSQLITAHPSYRFLPPCLLRRRY
ncbi:unnamed protein product [Ectocarpus sp. 12 AP-2014]